MKAIKTLAIILLFISSAQAQSDSSWSKKPTINFGGFIDAFYVYDFNEPADSKRQPFLFNHNRHNEFNINLGLLEVQVNHEKYRANLGLQSGTYPQDNYAAEASVFRNVYQANVGISLNKKNNLWLDAGLFPSNLGFESAISMDNLTLTRSLAAENSPYFLTGAKLTYNPTSKLELVALISNGWQRIERLEANSIPSFGTQVNYQLTEKINLNWSTFMGSEYPDTTRRMRYFNNFYSTFELSDKWNLIAGVDVGLEQARKESDRYESWYVPTLIAQYKWNDRWSTAIRAEYLSDEAEVILPQADPNGVGIWGTSLNIDYTPNKMVAWRIEGRYLENKDSDFNVLTSSPYTSFFISTSLAVKFGK